ncbi:unnamed protein product [Haemonchus placei]|uniref:Ig-like domain-containing protein n=1 Tax=Haemonchus placei TaxID=6290 RepID=A0A0N4WJX9_HAEPC|nr:unnamed protein product [Haemonchus placei]
MCLFFMIALIQMTECQKIVTKGKTITVNEGEQLELPCYVQDLGSGPIIWRRKENPLFIDEENLAEDERMQNSTLTILDVEPMDMSDYVCAVLEPEQEIVYKIIVHSPTGIVWHATNDDSHLDGSMKLANHRFQITLPQRDKLVVKDGRMPSDLSVRGPQLVISKAKKSHSGEYECTATNAAGSDFATLKIQVNGEQIFGSSLFRTSSQCRLTLLPLFSHACKKMFYFSCFF